MSFNIRYGTASDGENSWPMRREAVIGFLRTCGYDVIGLQEALYTQLQEIREAAPFLHYVGVGRDDGAIEGEYCAILYDSRRVELNSSDVFWLSATPDGVASSSWGNELTRICTHAAFEVEGRTIDLFNTHLDHESAFSRWKSVELILGRVRARSFSGPVIVTGDFNEPERGPAVAEMISGGLIDTYRDRNPEGPEQATYHGWCPIAVGDKIDYVFVTPDIDIVDATIIRDTPFRKFLSDHHPVVATLMI